MEYFEKENIYTFDGKGELLITIMSSLAQEESRSISENVTWGHRRRFADGKMIMPFSSFLGYERGEDGQPKIVESEARIVRLIYRMFLEDKTPTYIAKYLTGENIPTPRGSQKWPVATVESILKNEKYKGSALLQKTFTVDFLSKKKKVNEGEIPQYYVEDSHPAIISKEVYDLVQLEFEKRKKSGNYKTTASIFSGMMFCGDCGSIYGSKVWHSNTKHRKTVWQCNSKFKNEKKCTTPHLTEEQLKSAFIDVFNSLIKNKEAILNFAQAGIEKVINGSIKTADKKIKYYTEDYNEKRGEVQKYIDLNRKTTIPQEEYNLKFDELMKVYKKVQNNLKQAENEKTELIGKIKQCNAFIDRLKERSQLLAEFDEELFAGTVDKIVVYNECLIFIFRDRRKITYPLKMANNSV